MALFRRNKTSDTVAVPEEVNSYYQAENRERTWMAWLLALVTLAVTAIVIIGLFFGGRWIYRKVRHNSPATTAGVTQKATEPIKSGAVNPTPTPAPDTTNPAPTNGNVNAPTNPATNSASPLTANNAPAASTSTPNNTNLPNTGPGDILSVFAVVSMIAYILHRRLQKQ